MNDHRDTPLFEVARLRRWFRDGRNVTEVLRGIDFEIERGERVAVVGSSGSGKTTLLQILGGLDDASDGRVCLNGMEWARLGAAERGRRRNRYLGFVYQFHHLLPEFSALENTMLPLLLRGDSTVAARREARHWLTAVGLEHRLRHKPGALSGGERQRAALARAMVTRPAALLADEPTGNLDAERASQVFDLMLELNASGDTALVVVTHDLTLAGRLSRTIRLRSGEIETGVPDSS